VNSAAPHFFRRASALRRPIMLAALVSGFMVNIIKLTLGYLMKHNEKGRRAIFFGERQEEGRTVETFRHLKTKKNRADWF
jgi:hypothetical protein